MVGRYEESSAWVWAWRVESGTQGDVPDRVRTYIWRRNVHGLHRVALAVAAATVGATSVSLGRMYGLPV